MSLNEIFVILISTIELTTLLLLTLSIFRIPLGHAFWRTIFIALAMSCTATFMRSFAELVIFSTISIIIVQMVLIMAFFRIPLIFTSILGIVTLLSAGLIESVVAILAFYMEFIPEPFVYNRVKHLLIIDFSVAVIALSIMLILQRKKIGFIFMMRHISLHTVLRGYNFYISTFSVLLIFSVPIFLNKMINYEHALHHSIYYAAGFAIILLLFIMIAYRKNMRELGNKYKKMNKRYIS